MIEEIMLIIFGVLLAEFFHILLRTFKKKSKLKFGSIGKSGGSFMSPEGGEYDLTSYYIEIKNEGRKNARACYAYLGFKGEDEKTEINLPLIWTEHYSTEGKPWINNPIDILPNSRFYCMICFHVPSYHSPLMIVKELNEERKIKERHTFDSGTYDIVLSIISEGDSIKKDAVINVSDKDITIDLK